jgi:hypothetical protein
VLWELVFMLVILKIPVVYLCVVVWWAIKAEPEPLERAARLAPLPPEPSCDWRRRRSSLLRRGPLPRGGRPARVAHVRARVHA